MKKMKGLFALGTGALLMFGCVVPTDGAIGELLIRTGFCQIVEASENVVDGDFEYEVFKEENRATLIKYNGNDSVVTIPEKVGDVTVKNIGKNAFRENANLTNVVFPSTLESIDGFYKCTNLKSVDIPGSVKVIAGGTFSECTSLTTVTIADGITAIEASTFWGCQSLTSITIPGTVTTIQSWAFKDCTGLTDIVLPKGVLAIFKEAFEGCSNLSNVTIPSTISMIEEGAFKGCNVSLTITGTTGSYAETYAKANGFLFKEQDKKEASSDDNATELNIENKKSYKKTKKVTIKDEDGLKTVKLNSKKISVKKGKTSISFKFSKYKKNLKQKGKWNKLVVTDIKGNKTTIKFKIK